MIRQTPRPLFCKAGKFCQATSGIIPFVSPAMTVNREWKHLWDTESSVSFGSGLDWKQTSIISLQSNSKYLSEICTINKTYLHKNPQPQDCLAKIKIIKKKANNKKKSSIITTSSVGIGQQYLKIQGMVKGNGITQQSVVPPDTFIIDIPTWNKSV